MNDQFSPFSGSLVTGFQNTNRQLLVLLETLFFMLIRVILYAIPGVVLFGIGWFADIHTTNRAGFWVEVLATIYFIYVAIMFNAALGLSYAYIATGEHSGREISKKSAEKAWQFSKHGWITGNFLLFGQIFLVCPCFLLLDNFIFSPFLFVYEGMYGKKAEERSVELAQGSEWFILNRTLSLLLINYSFLIISASLLFTRLYILGIVLLVVGTIYTGLFQSNYIYTFYKEAIAVRQSGAEIHASSKYRTYTIIAIVGLIAAYIIFKFLPYIIFKLHLFS